MFNVLPHGDEVEVEVAIADFINLKNVGQLMRTIGVGGGGNFTAEENDYYNAL